MKSNIQTGDRYIKVDAPTIVWVVGKSVNLNASIPHVHLVQEKMPNRKITLSVSALQDTSIHKKIEANP